jgi:Cyanate lyase C-terminal domain
MVMVNGAAWKALIEEEFGDDMAMERVANPRGDRVKITMSGKFLAVQILRHHRQRAGIWLQGGVILPVIPGRVGDANPESRSRFQLSRDSGFMLRTPRNDRETMFPPSAA